MYIKGFMQITDRGSRFGRFCASMTDDKRPVFRLNAVKQALDIVRRHHDPRQLRILCSVLM